jgi:hypothetical protein
VARRFRKSAGPEWCCLPPNDSTESPAPDAERVPGASLSHLGASSSPWLGKTCFPVQLRGFHTMLRAPLMPSNAIPLMPIQQIQQSPGWVTQCMVRPCLARGLLRVGGCAALYHCIGPLIGAFVLRAIMVMEHIPQARVVTSKPSYSITSSWPRRPRGRGLR